MWLEILHRLPRSSRVAVVVIAVLASAFAFAAPLRAAPFVNLDFEQAVVPPGSMNFLPAALAFPGWTPRVGETPLAFVYYNNNGIGEGAVTLYDQPLPVGGFHVIQGQYSVALFTDHGFNRVASLSQTGDVPAGTRSLRFLSTNSRPPPRVYADGASLNLVQMSLPFGPPGQGRIIWGADATFLAGQTGVTLRMASGPLPNLDTACSVDAISWSSEAIPEPCLSAVAAISVLWAASRRANRS